MSKRPAPVTDAPSDGVCPEPMETRSTTLEAGASATCPLCGSGGARLLEQVSVTHLEHEYQRQQGIGVLPEFPKDATDLRLLRCETCGLEFFHPLVAGSSDFYLRLSQASTYYSTTRWEFGEALKRLPDHADLVDVGCGDGFFLGLVPGERKRGLEYNPAAVKRARAAGLNVEKESLENLPADSADVVTLFQVLEHVSQPLRLIQEAVRILRPGGRLFIAVPNNDGWVGMAPPNPLNAPPHHTLRWGAKSLRSLAGLAGLRLEELLVEPLASEHVFAFRRSRVISRAARLLGWDVPRYGLTSGAVALRKVATLWVKCVPAGSLVGMIGAGHSLLALYRKPPAKP